LIILDDAINIDTQEEIKKIFLSDEFPWFYKPENTFTVEGSNTPCLSHFFVIRGAINSTYSGILNLLITDCYKKIPDKVIKKFSHMVYARSFLQFPLNSNFCKTSVDALHVDYDLEHYVLLYYVMDSDGDTIITDTIYNKDKEISLKLEDHKEVHRIQPKQGRIVLFDGSYYHTAEQPTNNVRCVINIDLVKPKPV